MKSPKFAFALAFVLTFFVLGLVKDWLLTTPDSPKIVTGDFSALLIDGQPTIYHSPSCSVCTTLLVYLDKQNVAYGQKNIDANVQYNREFQQLNINTIPLIITRDYAIVGFHQSEVDKVFNKNNKAS